MGLPGNMVFGVLPKHLQMEKLSMSGAQFVSSYDPEGKILLEVAE